MSFSLNASIMLLHYIFQWHSVQMCIRPNDFNRWHSRFSNAFETWTFVPSSHCYSLHVLSENSWYWKTRPSSPEKFFNKCLVQFIFPQVGCKAALLAASFIIITCSIPVVQTKQIFWKWFVRKKNCRAMFKTHFITGSDVSLQEITSYFKGYPAVWKRNLWPLLQCKIASEW